MCSLGINLAEQVFTRSAYVPPTPPTPPYPPPHPAQARSFVARPNLVIFASVGDDSCYSSEMFLKPPSPKCLSPTGVVVVVLGGGNIW